MAYEARERAIKACQNVLKGLQDHKCAAPFNQPVDYVALNIPQYPEVIKYPMDYGTIESKLREGEYKTMEDWTVDMQLVLTNAKIFNPPDHPVHQWASQLQAIFDRKLIQLNAKPEMAAFKKPQRMRRGNPMPDADWQACRNVLRQVQQNGQAYPFLQPVDWKALGIPDYAKIVKNPMDIGTIEKYLTSYLYSSPDEFADDMRLVFSNARRYNLEGSDIHQMSIDLEAYFESRWADMLKTRGTKRTGDALQEDASGEAQQAEPAAVDHDPAQMVSETTNVQSEVADNERRDLGTKINLLNGEHLGQLVDLVKDECPRSYQLLSEDECEINIDSLSREDFDRITVFVDGCV